MNSMRNPESAFLYHPSNKRLSKIIFGDLAVADLVVQNAQRLGVFRRDDDAAGVAVDAVAKRRGKGVFPPGVPLFLLI